MIPDNLLNDIIRDLVGNDIVPLVQLIKGKAHVSEFKLAEKLEISVNHVRNMLYTLSAYNLVESIRKKDKKKGWYVYYWTLDLIKLKDLALRKREELLLQLQRRLHNEEQGDFFICPDKHIRADLTRAMEYDFTCPECGLTLDRENNAKIVQQTKKRIEKIKEDIEVLRSIKIKPVVPKKVVKPKVVKKPKKVKAKKKVVKKKPKSKIHKVLKKAFKKKVKKKRR